MIENSSKDWPAIVIGVIVFINMAVNAYLLIYPQELGNFAFVPQKAFELLISGQILVVIKSYLLSMFTQQTTSHLLSNMIAIYFVGVDIARRKGVVTFLAVYFTGGLGVNLLLTLLGFWNTIPVIGASGALAALFGFYCFISLEDIKVEYRKKLLFIPVAASLLLVGAGIFFGNWHLFPAVTGLFATFAFIIGVFNQPRVVYWLIGINLWVLFQIYDLIMSFFDFYLAQGGIAGNSGHLFGIVIGLSMAQLLNKKLAQA